MTADIALSSLTTDEIATLITIERTGAGLSMVAIALTLLSFVVFKKLRTTPNLFLVIASLANAGASVASMIGYDGLHSGEHSALCQAQAFIFEWFMQSDSWWSFAMAFNVYLVFFHNVDPVAFRKFIWAYCIVCFGGPMVPAVVLIAIREDARGPVYGDAALWCWIGPNWSLVRFYSYYIPIWICNLLSLLVYAAVGYHVFHHRNQLLSITLHNRPDGKNQGELSRAGSGGAESAEEGLTQRNEVWGTVVTEVEVTTTLPTPDNEPSMLSPAQHTTAGLPFGSSWGSGLHADDSSFRHAPRHLFETICSSDSPTPQRNSLLSPLRTVLSEASSKLKHLDPVKMAYLRTSFIFGFAVLITWIPSSINRLYSLTHDDRINFGMSVASGCVLPLQGVWNAIIYLTTS